MEEGYSTPSLKVLAQCDPRIQKLFHTVANQVLAEILPPEPPDISIPCSTITVKPKVPQEYAHNSKTRAAFLLCYAAIVHCTAITLNIPIRLDPIFENQQIATLMSENSIINQVLKFNLDTQYD